MSARVNNSYLTTMTQDCECYSAVFLANARAELAQLRATVAAQAEQLRNATDLIRRVWEMADAETSTIDIEPESLAWQIEADTRAWLAANAPQQPQEEQSA